MVVVNIGSLRIAELSDRINRNLGNDADLLTAPVTLIQHELSWLSEAGSSIANAMPPVIATTGSVTPRCGPRRHRRCHKPFPAAGDSVCGGAQYEADGLVELTRDLGKADEAGRHQGTGERHQQG